ncbi:MAG: hypothetical protein HDQ87_03035 [Clostridia bacterium]|nr:hypothetical protein [Clostridia bacterium]
MTNEEFIDYVETHICEYLPPECQDGELGTRVYLRPNDEKNTGLYLMRPGLSGSPNVRLELYAEDCRNGRDLGEVMQEIADTLSSCGGLVPQPEAIDLDFEKVRGKLTTKLCDPSDSRDYLKDKPWTPVGEWGLLYRLQLLTDGDLVGSSPITYEIMNSWGMDSKTLHRLAVENESTKDPAWMSPIMEVAMHGQTIAGPNLLERGRPLNPSRNDTYVLSNRSRFNGACVVGWDGILDRVGAVLGRNFFILPSSIHEVLIIPDFERRSVEALELAVRQGNANPMVVQKDDILSNRIQYFDRRRCRLGSPKRLRRRTN